jgi:hypothetical protein
MNRSNSVIHQVYFGILPLFLCDKIHIISEAGNVSVLRLKMEKKTLLCWDFSLWCINISSPLILLPEDEDTPFLQKAVGFLI